ncbi:hypothetical protein FKM82_027161 [Ascaphus truei]
MSCLFFVPQENAGHPIQLVYTDGSGRLQLDESAVQSCFLGSEVSGYPVCLICVIGEKRRGKSFLMNYILRALHREVHNVMYTARHSRNTQDTII